MDIQIEQAAQCQPIISSIIDLPWLYRVIGLEKMILPKGGLRFNAVLFHEKATLSVTWLSSKDDERIVRGVLVTPRWTSKTICTEGQIIINRLLPVTKISEVNIFDTVPYEWVSDRTLVNDAKYLINLLPDYFIRLFNGIFWQHNRFHRLLLGPSSLNGHHNKKHGNLRHMIEVTISALSLAEHRDFINIPVLVTAALLHDAGKADEYNYNYERKIFQISTRGALIGHKLSIVEWIATAIAQYQIAIPENELLSLMHALTASKGAPDWVGIREPVSPEANLLSIADRLSGTDDLFRQTITTHGGFGKYHKHLRGRPFLVT